MLAFTLLSVCGLYRNAIHRAMEFFIYLPRHCFHRRVADHGQHLGRIHNAYEDAAALLVHNGITRQQQAQVDLLL